MSITLSELNSADRHTFAAVVGFVFEHAPWVAERAWARRPFHTIEELHRAMVDEVASAGMDEQLLLLKAHPDLGTRATMSSASAGEQAGAGFDSLTAVEAGEFRRLNTAYRAGRRSRRPRGRRRRWPCAADRRSRRRRW